MKRDPAVMFATPTLTHTNCTEYTVSLIQTLGLLKIPYAYRVQAGDQFIAKARNKIATEFLASPCTDLFFLDDDIGWPAHAVLKFLASPLDLIAGIYPKKSDTLDFPLELEVDAATGTLIERDGLVRALGVPTGFMRIKRHVIEKLAAHAGTFLDIEAGVTREFTEIFRTGVGPDRFFWGEDYTFCQNWRALGGEIWIDPIIKFTHRGTKRWEGTLGDSMPIFRQKASDIIAKAA